MKTLSTKENPWCRRFHPADDAPSRMICFPHAGGSASFYHPISASLSPAVDVLAIQYPGRQDRRTEPCIEDIGALADAAFEVIASWADRPLTFFGHSMGAIVAFEVARRFHRAGMADPVHLFVSGRRAPSWQRNEGVHLSSDDEIVSEVLSLGGTDARVLADEELLRLVLPVIRSDYKAIEKYRCAPDVRVPCKVTALVGDVDPHTSIDEVQAWQRHTSESMDLKVFPGGHFFLTSQLAAVIDIFTGHFTAEANR
ncbi:thioesterase II family protein [Streptomyces sp. NPDC004376]